MSRKLSNILVICAMVVIFPLLVIGSAFAAYYSINASVKVSIYADVTNDATSITLSTGAKDYKEDFELTGSHVGEVTIREKSVGYDFVGWYKGTAEQYEEDLDPQFIGTEDVLKVKYSDYENVLAVFEIKKYAVTYSYLADPTDTANTTETAPAAATTTNNVEGKTSYNYGEALPMLKTVNHHTFTGWVVNNVRYTKATFGATGTYQLSATKANGAWVENQRTVIVYNIDGQEPIVDNTQYANEEYTLPTVNSDNQITINGEVYDLGAPATGKRWAWVDANNNEVTKVTQNANVTLTKVDVKYTINVVSGADITYTGANSMLYKYNELSLDEVFNDSNYNKAYSFWKLGNVRYEGSDYTTAESLISAIKTNNPHNDATITLTANVQKYFTTVAVSSLKYRAFDGYAYEGPAYSMEDDINSEIIDGTIAETASTTSISDWIVLDADFYADNDATQSVTPRTLQVKVETTIVQIDLASVSTINDVLEIVYTTNNDINLADKLTGVEVSVWLR